MDTFLYKILQFPHFNDHRGNLSYIEGTNTVPFDIKRVYYISNVPPEKQRAGHAHKKLSQVLIAISGQFELTLDNGKEKTTIYLNNPQTGVLINPMTWIELKKFSETGFCLVLASDHYDKSDYIHSFDLFLKEKSNVSVINNQKIKFVDLSKEYKNLESDFDKAYKRIMLSGSYLLGEETKQLEKNLSTYCKVKNCIAVHSGLDALTLILKTLEISHGDEVIVPAFTFIATWMAVSNVGAIPVGVDISPETLNIDPKKIKKAITKKTKAIIPVHLFGLPAEMDNINKIAKKHNLFVIEDAAQALGATYKNKKVGNLADAAAFSFYPSKNIGSFGNGGAVTCKDPEIASKIRKLLNYGSEKKYHHDLIGLNSRISELQAAFLNIKLQKLDQINSLRSEYAEIYLSKLSGTQMDFQSQSKNSISSYHQFVILTKNRDKIKSYLEKNSIETLIHYPIPPHLSKAYNFLNYKKGSFPISEKISSSILSLPIYQHLSNDEILAISEKLLKFFTHNP